MKLYNFDKYPQNDKVYGGASGRKVGITINGEDYLIKYPGNLKDRGLKNIELSYSNSPLSEFLGSQIYKIIGIPVHDTYLGFRNDKLVIACKDFLQPGDQLQEFGQLKITMEPIIYNSNGIETDGTGTDLQETLETIRKHPLLESLSEELEARFWDMFLVDTLIGNPDRNNGNWGIIKHVDGSKTLSPVYDNGNCLNNKWSDEQLKANLENETKFASDCYKAKRCIFEENHKNINTYHYLRHTKELGCLFSLYDIGPIIINSKDEIFDLFDQIPPDIVSDIRKEFYKKTIETRIDNIFIPAYERAVTIIKEKQTFKEEFSKEEITDLLR